MVSYDFTANNSGARSYSKQAAEKDSTPEGGSRYGAKEEQVKGRGGNDEGELLRIMLKPSCAMKVGGLHTGEIDSVPDAHADFRKLNAQTNT